MFVDRARIRVTGGRGGNGCCSFRREKYVPRGGPDGGDGGDGGDVILLADDRLTSLLDIHYHSHWKGNPGVHGGGKNCQGARGENIEVLVPPGTVVHDAETGEVLADLAEPGHRFVAASGGRGGKGNARFVSATNRVPRFCEKGEPPEEREYLLELKMIAETGLVGLPNAGKSTLLSAISSARPKVADYPFTTLSPNLGVAFLSEYRTVTVADIPGIIEGAAEGKGLGHDFLRHIERTKVLVFLVDLGDEDPAATVEILERELEEHSPLFAEKTRLFAFNKCDITENRERFDSLPPRFKDALMISAATGEGTTELIEQLWNTLERVRAEEAGQVNLEPGQEYVYEAPFQIDPVPGGFRVSGKALERIVKMTDFENEQAVRHFQKRLLRMGILKALKRMGAEAGQQVVIGDVELEYEPD
jgi:GTPase